MPDKVLQEHAPRRRQYGPRIRHNDGAGHPLLFGMKQTVDFEDWPEGGGYAHGFLVKAYETLGVTDPNRVLHLCSGSVKVGIRVDIRPETNPTVVADCRRTPFPDESFDWIMADPPYSEAYADNLYDTKDDYPKPGQITKEASRLLRPGGRFGLLHFIVPPNPRELSLVGVWGLTFGAGYRIRAWSVFEKRQTSWIEGYKHPSRWNKPLSRWPKNSRVRREIERNRTGNGNLICGNCYFNVTDALT